ncbi:MAG: HNH endonuclease [Anaerolineae bacterium]|nr:HNH endonuclease [Anaerolineae bacterium]
MSYVPDELRRQIHTRAQGRCEYCLIHEQFTMKTHEVDHVVAEKHGGPTEDANLCLSCFDCNRHKGSDLCSLDTVSSAVVTLFHPRHDVWSDHFRLNGGFIEPLTPKGRVSARLLRMNTPERIAERARLKRLNRYP